MFPSHQPSVVMASYPGPRAADTWPLGETAAVKMSHLDPRAPRAPSPAPGVLRWGEAVRAPVGSRGRFRPTLQQLLGGAVHLHGQRTAHLDRILGVGSPQRDRQITTGAGGQCTK